MSPNPDFVVRLLAHLRQVREQLGHELRPVDAETRFADVVDSMGFVEFLALVAEDCGVAVETLEQATRRRYGSVGEFAAALDAAGLRADQSCSSPPAAPTTNPLPKGESVRGRPSAWLEATAAALPVHRQPASEINALLHRPPGWFEEHAGIESRCLWGDEDPLDAATGTAQDCLRQAGLSPDAVGALLVTSEAPPLPTGLAAALHARLGLPVRSAALEIGGACTGFLSALWTAQSLLANTTAVLVIAVETPSRWLPLSPTPAGEAAALFGDAAVSCLLTTQPTRADALGLRDILLGTDGAANSLLRIEMFAGQGPELHMDGIALAHRAVRTMAESVRQLCFQNGLTVDQLAAVIAHGGNGRMSDLLARRLNLPRQRVLSETTRTGNLGSASLPVAWINRNSAVSYPVI